jgi:hypothetical protein
MEVTPTKSFSVPSFIQYQSSHRGKCSRRQAGFDACSRQFQDKTMGLRHTRAIGTYTALLPSSLVLFIQIHFLRVCVFSQRYTDAPGS